MSQNIERSIHDLREMDTLASGDSPLHRVSAGAKLLVTVAYILVVVSFDKFNMSGLMFMVLYPALLFAVSGIPVSTCFYKLRFVLPIVCAVGIFNPILDRTPAFPLGSFVVTTGMISMITLLMNAGDPCSIHVCDAAASDFPVCGSARGGGQCDDPGLQPARAGAERDPLQSVGILSGTAPFKKHGPGG